MTVHRCVCCGGTSCGRYPDLAADHHGATTHRLLAAASHLQFGLGVPVRRLSDVLHVLTGATRTLAAPPQTKTAIGAPHQHLCDSVRNALYVHIDVANWRERDSPVWLMVLETDCPTVAMP